jgi:hypothetical protein
LILRIDRQEKPVIEIQRDKKLLLTVIGKDKFDAEIKPTGLQCKCSEAGIHWSIDLVAGTITLSASTLGAGTVFDCEIKATFGDVSLTKTVSINVSPSTPVVLEIKTTPLDETAGDEINQ